MKNKKKVHKIIVNINKEDIFSEYGCDNSEYVEESLVDTVMGLSNASPLADAVDFTFCKEKNVDIEEARLKKAYENTINGIIDDKKHQVFRCLFTGVLLFLIGILFLLFQFMVVEKYCGAMLTELCDLFSWVFLWAGVEILTIELIQIVIEIKKYKKALNCNFKLVDKLEEKKNSENENKPKTERKRKIKE